MKSRWKAVLVLVATFLLGGIAGAAITRAMVHRHLERNFRGPPAEARERFRLEAMARRLDLTDEQRTKIEGVLDRHRDERMRIFEKCRPEHEALREKVESEIRATLTPDQQELHDQLEKRRERRRGRPHGPPPRRGGPDHRRGHGPPR